MFCGIFLYIIAMIKECWKPVVGFEGLYEVSDKGRVRSIPRGVGKKPNGGILATRLTRCGYVQVHLYKDGKSYFRNVHRLVAQAFIPNPNNLPQVNHKSEVKTENFVENLEWVDAKTNSNFGTRTHRMAKKLEKRVHQFEGDELVGIYDSASLAAKFLGLKRDNIKHACQGLQKTCGGYRWTY